MWLKGGNGHAADIAMSCRVGWADPQEDSQLTCYPTDGIEIDLGSISS